jgi:hypothetical protein
MIGGSFHIGFSEIASFNDAIRQLYFFSEQFVLFSVCISPHHL